MDDSQTIPELRERLARRERELRAIHRITEALHARTRLDDLMRRTLLVAIDVARGSAGSLLIHDPARDRLVFRYVVGESAQITAELTGREMPADQGIAGSVFRTGQGVISPDLSRETRHFREIDHSTRYRTRSMITVALKTGASRALGVLEVLNRREGEFDTGDLEVLEILATQAASAMETARLTEHVLQAEISKKVFCREVIRCVTRDRLRLVDADEFRPPGAPEAEVDLGERDGYPTLRRILRESSERAGLEPERASDLVLAAGEAATNAIKHGGGGRALLYRCPDRLAVRVQDRGCGIQADNLPAAILMPGFSTQVSLGMGFTLMLQLVDQIWLATGPEGTVIQLESRLDGGAPVPDLLAGALARL